MAEFGDQENKDNRNKKKDPWDRQEEQGPPDLDEALRQLQARLRSLFGGGGRGPKVSGGFSKKPGRGKFFGGWYLLVGAGIVYLLSGIYIVGPAEEAVVLRLGRYVGTVLPGPHWIAPFIERKEIVNVQEVKTSKHGGQMLTRDENIVSAEIAVQYRIYNPKDYLFNVVHPERSLQQVSESALRAVVGQSTLNEVLTSGRSGIGTEIKRQVQQNLNNYHSGIEISDLAMQQTKAPEEVKAAFDDAIKAQQDEERLVNQAQAYAHKILPIAEGHAKRTFEEARAYKERVILEAEGKTAKFTKVLPEYQRAPGVMRDRLYLDTLQEVYTNTPKVLVDVAGGNNLVYLPLDKLLPESRRPLVIEESVAEEERIEGEPEGEKGNQSVPFRQMSGRPTYEQAERPMRGA